MGAEVNMERIALRRLESERTRQQSKRGFSRSNYGIAVRAKAAWLSWVPEAFRSWKTVRLFQRHRAQVRRQHLARLDSNPKYAARCARRRVAYERCIAGQTERHNPMLCGWMTKVEL